MDKIQKVDHGKPDLLFLLDMPYTATLFSQIMTEGGEKDGRTRDSWKNYKDPEGLAAALIRHLMAWRNGELIDLESGKPHLAHVVANAIILCETNPVQGGLKDSKPGGYLQLKVN